MNTWETQDGEVLKIREMDTYHITNCINMLQRHIDNGTAVREYGGMGSDNMDIWYDVEDVSDEFRADIKMFERELKRRVV